MHALASIPVLFLLAVPPSALSGPAPQSSSAQAAPPASRAGAGAKPLSTAGLKPQPFKTEDSKAGWKVRIPGGRALATPAVWGGKVFVGGGFGSHEFYAFDAATGKPRWALSLSDDGPTAAVADGDRVAFNTESCTLFMVEAATGKPLWSRWLGDPLMSQPALHGDLVLMAYPGRDGQHRLAALSAKDGKTRYERVIEGDIISAPVVEGDSVYLATLDGTVHRTGLADGKALWSKPMQATSAPWVAGEQVHVAKREKAVERPGNPPQDDNEGFVAMSPRSGQFVGPMKAAKSAGYLNPAKQAKSGYSAKQKSDDSSVGFGGGAPVSAKVDRALANTGQGTVRGLWEYQGSRPLVVGDRLFAVQGDVVRAVAADSDKVLWEHKLEGDTEKVGGHLATPPAYASGKLVVGTVTGKVFGLDAATGSELFRYDLKEEIRFQPALVKGVIYLGTTAGTLVAVDTGDLSLDGWTMWGGSPEHNGPREAPR